MINEIIGIITDTMPKDDNGNIIDKQLHSDLITAIQLAKNLHQPDVVGRSELLLAFCKEYHQRFGFTRADDAQPLIDAFLSKQ